MSKRKLIIIVSIVIAILFIIVIINKNNNKKIQLMKLLIPKKLILLMTMKHGLYYIRDSVTNEIITASSNEEDLEFYKENPDYNPNPLAPRSTDLSSFVDYSDDMENYVSN